MGETHALDEAQSWAGATPGKTKDQAREGGLTSRNRRQNWGERQAEVMAEGLGIRRSSQLWQGWCGVKNWSPSKGVVVGDGMSCQSNHPHSIALPVRMHDRPCYKCRARLASTEFHHTNS